MIQDADTGLPPGFRIRLDRSTRMIAGGSTLLGGSPRRLLRVSPGAAARLRDWANGRGPATAAERSLARRLTDGGLAHPLPPADAAAAATVSVVIPVRDRPLELDRCLAALSPELSVIVVDDGSADAPAIARVAAAHGARLVARGSSGGPGAARNSGLEATDAEVVVFLDSDCVPQPGWLEQLLPHFEDPLVDAVAPRIVALEAAHTWLAAYEAVRSPLDLGAEPGRVAPQTRVSYVPAAALAVRRSAAGDGFAPDMQVGEDVDFVWRLHAAGGHVRYEPAAQVAHEHRTEARAWLRRRVDYGLSAASLAQRHPGRLAPLAVSPWSAAAWALVLLIRPLSAGAVVLTAVWRVRRRLAGLEGRDEVALRVVAGGTLGAGRLLAEGVTRAWLPIAVVAALRSRTGRRLLLGAWLAPVAVDWLRCRPALDLGRYALTRLVDDAAYCYGVWLGCARRRTLDPLVPGASHARASDSVKPQAHTEELTWTKKRGRS